MTLDEFKESQPEKVAEKINHEKIILSKADEMQFQQSEKEKKEIEEMKEA